jgi:hypothetical protein
VTQLWHTSNRFFISFLTAKFIGFEVKDYGNPLHYIPIWRLWNMFAYYRTINYSKVHEKNKTTLSLIIVSDVLPYVIMFYRFISMLAYILMYAFSIVAIVQNIQSNLLLAVALGLWTLKCHIFHTLHFDKLTTKAFHNCSVMQKKSCTHNMCVT